MVSSISLNKCSIILTWVRGTFLSEQKLHPRPHPLDSSIDGWKSLNELNNEQAKADKQMLSH